MTKSQPATCGPGYSIEKKRFLLYSSVTNEQYVVLVSHSVFNQVTLLLVQSPSLDTWESCFRNRFWHKLLAKSNTGMWIINKISPSNWLGQGLAAILSLVYYLKTKEEERGIVEDARYRVRWRHIIHCNSCRDQPKEEEKAASQMAFHLLLSKLVKLHVLLLLPFIASYTR